MNAEYPASLKFGLSVMDSDFEEGAVRGASSRAGCC
jgi:hypothetical protein